MYDEMAAAHRRFLPDRLMRWTRAGRLEHVRSEPSLLLGVDGGNTKTVAVVATRDGTVLGTGRAGLLRHLQRRPARGTRLTRFVAPSSAR